MKNILERISNGDILFCDGAMGTLLQNKGLQPGECPELWCINHAEQVKDIHREYRKAGSDIVECNSFGANRFKLAHYGLEARAAEINQAAASLAKDVAGDSQYVLASAGPTGEFMAPLGLKTKDDFIEVFQEQMTAFEAGGADMVIIETMTALEEAAAAVEAAKSKTDLIVAVSFTFDPQAKGGYATMMGITPERFASEMVDIGADIIGANCGTGSDHMIEIVKLLRSAVAKTPIFAMPNAGMPVIENGKTAFKETPEAMAKQAPVLVDAGVNIIGGCCGTTPAHIAAMRDAISHR